MTDQTPQEATPEQQAQLAQEAAQTAAAPGQTPEQARTNTRKAVRRRADELKIDLNDEHIDKIASAVVSKIEEWGGFDQPETPTPPASASAASAAAAAQSAAGETPTPPEAPRKRSIAERILGG